MHRQFARSLGVSAEGWLDEARKITALLFDGLCHRAPGRPEPEDAGGVLWAA
ncbi:hypothetical protein [Actinomadura monticuli]|uniref:Uncharacterized protein n=1 Tax=Actinomadura monticuli TaxID=3097367 RepID=A0ABV4Q768_9ACTN